MSTVKKISYSIVIVLKDFTQRLFKIIEKIIVKHFVYVARGPERENERCAVVLLIIIRATLQ